MGLLSKGKQWLNICSVEKWLTECINKDEYVTKNSKYTKTFKYMFKRKILQNCYKIQVKATSFYWRFKGVTVQNKTEKKPKINQS